MNMELQQIWTGKLFDSANLFPQVKESEPMRGIEVSIIMTDIIIVTISNMIGHHSDLNNHVKWNCHK